MEDQTVSGSLVSANGHIQNAYALYLTLDARSMADYLAHVEADHKAEIVVRYLDEVPAMNEVREFTLQEFLGALGFRAGCRGEDTLLSE